MWSMNGETLRLAVRWYDLYTANQRDEHQSSLAYPNCKQTNKCKIIQYGSMQAKRNESVRIYLYKR